MLAHISFGYGNVTIRFAAETVAMSDAVYGTRDHAFGFSRGDGGEAAPQLRDEPLVVVDAAARGRAPGRLEQRVHLRRRQREVRHLVGARTRPVVAPDVRGTAGSSGVGPVKPGLRLRALGPRQRV